MRNFMLAGAGPGKKIIPNRNNTFVLLGKESLWLKNLPAKKKMEGTAKN